MLFCRWMLILLGLCGCSMAVATPSPASPTSIPTEMPIPNQISWQTLSPGLEKRVYFPPPENEVTKITALRIDPAVFTFRVHYHPGAPLTIRQWADALPGAVAFVNANFFDENGNILGLLVADGQGYGQSFVDRGGTFLVQNGQPRVRSNIAEPYAGESFEQAVQGFPMLMLNGAQAYTDTTQDRYTRRTVIAQDSNGRIVLLVTPLIGLTLLDLSNFLPTTDMNLTNALNLDGGGSTLMYLNVGGAPEYIVSSLDPVPAVLAIYPR
ncbi:MAG: phosphodiester glycosidase family protein [Chloroflexota bacterium]